MPTIKISYKHTINQSIMKIKIQTKLKMKIGKLVNLPPTKTQLVI
jgi:hypothetical protein